MDCKVFESKQNSRAGSCFRDPVTSLLDEVAEVLRGDSFHVKQIVNAVRTRIPFC